MIDIAYIIDKKEQHINSNAKCPGAESYMSPVSFILEFRIIGLRLPRQSGKTNFLLNKFFRTNSMMLVANHYIASHCKTLVRSQLREYIQVCHSGADSAIFHKFMCKSTERLQYLLIDEAVNQHDLAKVLTTLLNLKMIDTRLTIIQLQT